MAKDYKNWYILKSHLESERTTSIFNQQEVWWCSLGANIGVEMDGKNRLFERPVLVLHKFNRHMFWGLPLTSKQKTGRFYHTFVLHGKEEFINFAQLRLLSSKRLIRRMGKVSD